MPYPIPEKMRAIVQHSPGSTPVVTEIPIPVPGRGEVLVKMAASPINPSDLSLLNGTYATKPEYPVVPGLEGSGIVVASGGGIIAGLRKGKRVACTATPGRGGTWAQYMVTRAMHTIPVGNRGFENASMVIVNPLTALAFLNIATRGKHRAVVNTAASSSLGRMIARLLRRNNIPLVNIVRSDEHVRLLKAAGDRYVLNSSDSHFRDILADLLMELGATLLLDAVGGDMPGILLDSSPAGSRIVLYANLSEKDFGADPRRLIQENKTIEGFFLGSYTGKRGLLSNLADTIKARRMITGDLSSEIAGLYPLEEINTGLINYRSAMSKGKVLIIPNREMISLKD